MKKLTILLVFVISIFSFSYTVGVITSYSTMTYQILNDASNLLNDYEYSKDIRFITNASETSFDCYINLYLTFDSTNNVYKATYEDGQYLVSSLYSPNGFKSYKTFLQEVIYYPLEKISFHKLKSRDFDKYLRLTYHPGIDEYGDFKDNKFLFITDRLAGNRNIAYIDLNNESINLLPVWGSSEYYPRFSPDMTMIAFQGSLHGTWNIYVMPFGEKDYAKKIKKISNAELAAYTPAWYGNETLVYVQDTEKGNVMIKGDIYNKHKEKLNTYGDMVFTPYVHGDKIFYSSLNGANFGIYEYESNKNEVIEDSFFNEHDPVFYNGKLIFTSNRDGIYRIWMKDLETSSVTCLTPDINYDVFYPTVNNGLLFFSVYKDNEEPDIYVKKLDF